MLHALAPGQLLLGYLHVLQQLGALDQPLVFGDVEQNGGAPAVLGEDDGTVGGLDLLHEGSRVGAEFGERADVFAEADEGHGDPCWRQVSVRT